MSTVTHSDAEREAEHRAAIIAGLRELADKLDRNPGLAVPSYMTINACVDDNDGDAAAYATVRRAADILGVTAKESPDRLVAKAGFGPTVGYSPRVTYDVYHITAAGMAAYDARDSYCDNVRVDGLRLVDLHADLHPEPGDQPSAPIPAGVDGTALGHRTGEHPIVAPAEPLFERPNGCDSPYPPSLYRNADGTTVCRCVVCGRCGHHTGNTHQGHYWAYCKVTKQQEAFHFCCPGDCEIYPPAAALTPDAEPADELAAMKAAGIPRVFTRLDPEPTDVRRVADADEDIWDQADDGTWRCGTLTREWCGLVRNWGPLTEVFDAPVSEAL